MVQRYKRICTLMIAAALFALAGCATSPPPTFYQLEEPASTQLSGLERGIAIGVGPVNMAAYLDRPQIVTRAEAHKLNLSEGNVWAEPLKQSITRVIGVNLSNMLQTTRIFRFPTRNRAIPLAYRIALDIPRFDGTLGGDVQLVARWTLYKGQGEDALLTRVSIISEASGGEGYEKLITAQNRALQALSREIADAVKKAQ
ncbi:MAG: PqiC family protein [Syntrophobacterales bacterium]|jgi:hypothetical protein